MICALDGQWARYQSANTSLHGPWREADASFAVVPGTKQKVGGSSGASFLPLPSPRAGEPTHVIADGSNSQRRVCHEAIIRI